MGCLLAKKGKKAKDISNAAHFLAVLYEGTTLNMNIPTQYTISKDPRAAILVEASEDIAINTEGATYGSSICK